MTDGSKKVRAGAVGMTVLAVLGAATALQAQQPAPGAPAAASPSGSAPAFEAKIAPPAAAEQKFVAELQPRAGALKADDVARRAEMTSPEVISKMRAVEGAAAKVDQAAINFAPRLQLLARYMRLSPISYPNFGYIAGGRTDGPITSQCNAAGECVATNAMLAAFAFPSPPVNMSTLQATLQVPLSDYVFRMDAELLGAEQVAERCPAAGRRRRAPRCSAMPACRTTTGFARAAACRSPSKGSRPPRRISRTLAWRCRSARLRKRTSCAWSRRSRRPSCWSSARATSCRSCRNSCG